MRTSGPIACWRPPIPAFVILEGLVVSGGRKRAVRIAGDWDVFQQIAGGCGPDALGNGGTGKDASGGSASLRVVGFTGGDGVTQLL